MQVDTLLGPALLDDVEAKATILESFTAGVIIVDPLGRIRWLSEGYADLLQLPQRKAVYGEPVEQLIPNSRLRQVLDSGEPILMDLMRLGDSWVLVSRYPLHDRQGNLCGALGMVFHDHIDELKPLVAKYAKLRQLPRFKPSPAGQRLGNYSFADLCGESPAFRDMLARARKMAELDTTVLLLGETGTGKELLAHAIHNASPRAERPFIALNMAASPEGLLEAELFGAAAGAYTGADRKGRQGKFRLADSGTLFLDEIGDMPQSLQSKLLRALQEQEVEPLGSNRVEPINVRVIAATSRNLQAMVDDGRFRADLYYRLSVLSIRIPPLRERPADLPVLCRQLIRQICRKMAIPQKRLSVEALALLRRQIWQGNVRELRNTLESACIFAESEWIQAGDFAKVLPDARRIPHRLESEAVRPLAEQVADAERRAIEQALAQCRGRRAEAARLLGIGRATLYEKMARYGIR